METKKKNRGLIAIIIILVILKKYLNRKSNTFYFQSVDKVQYSFILCVLDR